MRKLIWFLLAATLFVDACDKNELSGIDQAAEAPSILSVNISPDSINIDTIVPIGGVYSVDTRVSTHVYDPKGRDDITNVISRLVTPGNSATLAQTTLKDDGIAPDSVAGDGFFSGYLHMEIVRSQIGRYHVIVAAADRNGSQSNTTQRTLHISKNNSPPLLSSFPSIHQFSPPGTDSTFLTISVAATDSDGLEDISFVSVNVLNAADSSARQLFDDGSPVHGDFFPGDGVFSSTFWVRPLAGVQNLSIVFLARDRRGGMSDSVRRSLTNSRPHILQVTAPDSIQRPSTGTVLIPLFLAAHDSDGLGDIDSVFFTNLSSSNPTNLLMYDDGNLLANGDTTRGDGIYSRIVSVDPTTTLGTKNFQFNVKDRFGEKDSLRRLITIY